MANLFSSSQIERILNARHYNRGIAAHKAMVEALESPLINHQAPIQR